MTKQIEVRNARNPFPPPQVVDPEERSKTLTELVDECHYILYENFITAQVLAKHFTGSEYLFLLDDEEWAIPTSGAFTDQINALRHQGYNINEVLKQILFALGITLGQKTAVNDEALENSKFTAKR
jgi:hypothetical protein